MAKLNTTKSASIIFPLAHVRTLGRSSRGKKLMVEVDVSAMKKVNDPGTIDEMVAEARLEYYAGSTKNFTSAEALMKELRS